MKLTLIALFFTLASTAQELNFNLVYHWNNPSIPGSWAYDNKYNEVWGYAANGREYAFTGSTRGTHIHDVTDPWSAYQADLVTGRDTGGIIIHRDFKTFNNYLYMVADEGNSSLQIADMSYLPDSVHIVYDSNTHFSRSHNLFIDTARARLYVCGGPFSLKIFSLTNPASPTLLLDCNSGTVPFWGPIGHIHDLYVKNDTAYLHAGNNGMYIVDFSNIASPQLIGEVTFYPDRGYNHSGWLDAARDAYYFADENHGYKVKALDISDLGNISVTDTFTSGITPSSIAHNLFVKGDYLYTSYYYDGLQVFNISDPGNVTKAGSYDTYPAANTGSYQGAWGVYPYLPSGNILVSDMQTGLYVFSETPVGIRQNDQQSTFQVFPNPSADRINIRFSGSSEETFTLLDSGGRLVKRFTVVNGEPVDISDLPPGLYLLQSQTFPSSGRRLVVTAP